MTKDKHVVKHAHRSVARLLRNLKHRGHMTPTWTKTPVKDGVLTFHMESYWKGVVDLAEFKQRGFAVSKSTASKTKCHSGMVYSVLLLQEADYCKLVVTSTPAPALL